MLLEANIEVEKGTTILVEESIEMRIIHHLIVMVNKPAYLQSEKTNPLINLLAQIIYGTVHSTNIPLEARSMYLRLWNLITSTISLPSVETESYKLSFYPHVIHLLEFTT